MYELELEKIIEQIKKVKAKCVCLQLPDGLKPKAVQLVRELEQRARKNGLKTKFFIWAGSNFGGCDWPWYLKDLGVDLVVNFGHAKFRK